MSMAVPLPIPVRSFFKYVHIYALPASIRADGRRDRACMPTVGLRDVRQRRTMRQERLRSRYGRGNTSWLPKARYTSRARGPERMRKKTRTGLSGSLTRLYDAYENGANRASRRNVTILGKNRDPARRLLKRGWGD